MKRRLFILSVIFLFILMLFFPTPVFEGASEGILLWFQIVLPTLLPFILLSNLMIQTNAVYYISKITGPVLGKIFGVSNSGSFAVISGFLCGYPMGAKVTSDLLRTGRISYEEASYLLSFCNNTSPMFIISYVVMQNTPSDRLVIPSIAILFLSPAICSRIFFPFYKKSLVSNRFPGLSPAKERPFSLTILDTCMMNSFEAIAKVGGYIMLFSIITKLACLLPWNNWIPFQIFLSFLEITAGIPVITKLSILPWSMRWMLILGLTSFGGLCAAAQTSCMIQGSELKISSYLIEKLVTMSVTSLLCLGIFGILF